MKKGAKRQVVLCPMCGNLKVTLGEVFFRCCGEEHKITSNLATRDAMRSAVQGDALEVVI